MRIAYLVNRYPAVSHSFIRREILALERLGFDVTRIALRGWDSVLVDEDDLRERERTHYVVSEGAPAIFVAVARMLLTRPVALLRAFVLAWRMSRGADRPLPLHLIYLAEACVGRPALELHQPWAGRIRPGSGDRLDGENPPLCVRSGDQLIWPQPALSVCRA